MLRTLVLRPLLRILKFTITGTVTLLICGLIAVLGSYFYFARDLPNIQRLEDYKAPVVSEVFAADGSKVGEFWEERRFLATRADLPDVLTNAFIAAEDARFYEHSGVDPQGILRAILKDVQAGGFVQGASTITQQVTRALLLTRERRLERKIREAILATRLERNLSKDEILTLYLNQIYLGNRSYGVISAAENYFRKSLNDLTIAEAAMIGGLARAPATDNPLRNPDAAKQRQAYVLERMRHNGFITTDEADAARKAPLTIYHAVVDKTFNQRHTPYFTEHVRRELLERFGKEAVYTGGLRVETTVNPAQYRAAEAALRRGVERVDQRTRRWQGPVAQALSNDEQAQLAAQVHEAAIALSDQAFFSIPQQEQHDLATPVSPRSNYQGIVTARDGGELTIRVGNNTGTIAKEDHSWVRKTIRIGDVVEVRPTDANGTQYILTQTPDVQGALLSMEAQTGFVRAMVGGYDYADRARNGEFIRATQALRQPGSSFKPLVYAAALDKGFNYNTPIADSPIAYQVGKHEIWSPKNSGGKFSGVGPLLDHITYSRNVPAVKIGYAVGLDYVTAYARKFGLTSPLTKALSMSLGANGAYLHELVRAYATFPNLGRTPEQVFITKVTGPHGELLYEYKSPETTPLAASGQSDEEVGAGLREHFTAQLPRWVERDQLALDPEEEHVLFGNRIPAGYTITPQTAHLVTGLLRSVVQRGTATVVSDVGPAIAGKTGTTNENTDTWFIGYTPSVVTGVWVGHDKLKRIGRGEEGGKTAAPIWRDYMAHVVDKDSEERFAVPEHLQGAELAVLTGGSAAYWQRGIDGSIAQEAEEMKEQRMNDRAVDFFTEDFEEEFEEL